MRIGGGHFVVAAWVRTPIKTARNIARTAQPILPANESLLEIACMGPNTYDATPTLALLVSAVSAPVRQISLLPRAPSSTWQASDHQTVEEPARGSSFRNRRRNKVSSDHLPGPMIKIINATNQNTNGSAIANLLGLEKNARKESRSAVQYAVVISIKTPSAVMRESSPIASRIPADEFKAGYKRSSAAGRGQSEAGKKFGHVRQIVQLAPAVLRKLPSPIHTDGQQKRRLQADTTRKNPSYRRSIWFCKVLMGCRCSLCHRRLTRGGLFIFGGFFQAAKPAERRPSTKPVLYLRRAFFRGHRALAQSGVNRGMQRFSRMQRRQNLELLAHQAPEINIFVQAMHRQKYRARL